MLAETVQAWCPGCLALAQGVHVHPDAPAHLLIVADNAVSPTPLAPGPGIWCSCRPRRCTPGRPCSICRCTPAHWPALQHSSYRVHPPCFPFLRQEMPCCCTLCPHHSLVLVPRQGLCTPFARLLSFCSTMVRHFEKSLIFFKKILDKTAGFRYYSGAPRAPAQRQNKRCGKMAELV